MPAWQCADCEELDTVPPHERADYELRKTLGIFRREKEEQIKRKYGDRRNNRILFAQAIELRFRTGEEVLKEIFVMLRCDPATNERELYLRIGRDQLEPWMSEPCDDAYARERLNTRLRRWKEDLSEHCSIHTVTGWVDEETYFELMASRAS